MRRLPAFLAAVAFASAAWAGDGTTGAASLKMGTGARGQGFGDAYATVAEGAESLYWNPAGLVRGGARHVMVGYQPLLDGASSGQAAFSGRRGRWGFGAGYSGLDQGSFDALDTFGNKTGGFSAKDQTFAAGAAYGTARLAFGVAGKYWSSKIDGVGASVFAGDAGLSFENPFSSRFRHSIVARHVGSDVSYVTQKDPLPTTAVFGTSVRLGRFTLSDDVATQRGHGFFNSIGIEAEVAKSASLDFRLRGGYTDRRNKSEKMSGAAFGAGFGLKSFTLDYAWIPFGELGDAHAVTITWRRAAPQTRELLQPTYSAPPSSVKGKVTSSSPTQRRRLDHLDQPGWK